MVVVTMPKDLKAEKTSAAKVTHAVKVARISRERKMFLLEVNGRTTSPPR